MAYVVDEKAVFVKTNVGKLYFPVFYLDEPIIEGQQINVGYVAGGTERWYPLVTPRSVFASENVHTEFLSDGGHVEGKTYNGQYQVNIYDDQHQPVRTETASITSGKLASLGYPILIGSNGVAFMGVALSTYNISSATLYNPNTSAAFGAYARTDYTGVVVATVQSSDITAATYLLKESTTGGIVDPYEEGGTSEENLGGNGSFDDGSDQIDDSTLPTISAANTGFTRIYNPTLAQVRALASYLWTDQTIIQTLWNHVKQFLENPMDAFIAFNLVPCAVPDGGTTEFKVMYIGTGVNMTAAASQFVDVDCGTLDIDEYYGSALDYAPNTKISVFLPFIGTVQLDTDDVMGKTIGVKYRIDIVSGGCVAKIIVDGSIHYQYSGHCAVNIPFTSADYTGYISAMLQAAKVGSTIASAGASAAAATAEEGVAIPEMAAAGATAAEMMEASKAYDRRIAASGAEGAAQATFSSLAPKNISNTVGVVMSSKPVVERSGSFSGNTGYLGIRRPFCIIERPRMCNPSEYGKYNGRPAMITMSLGDCSGFTKVQQVQLTGIPATNPELDEIGAFLKGGVIL